MGWTVKSWFHLSRAVLTMAVAISVSVSVLGQVGCSEAGGRMRAIIIGINEYRHIKPLKGADADARDIREQVVQDAGLVAIVSARSYEAFGLTSA